MAHFNEHVAESVHADELDVSEEEMASVLSEEVDEGEEVTPTGQMQAQQTEEEDNAAETEQDTENEAETEEPSEDEQVAEPSEDEESDTDTEEHEEESPKNKQSPAIPKSRFDEVNNERKEYKAKLEEMERRMRELEQGKTAENQPQQEQPKQPEFDFNAKEREYMEAVLDGEEDKALSIRSEIRKAEADLYQHQSQQTSAQEVQQYQMQQSVEQEVARINQEAPMLNGSSDQFNQEAFDFAMELRDGFIARGNSPVEAIRKAANAATKAFGQPQPQAEQKPAAKPKKQPVNKEKLEAANNQPPTINDKTPSGNDSAPKINVMNMSEEEFDNLSEDEINKLIGTS